MWPATGFPVAIREINVKIATTMRFVAAAEQVLIGFLVVRSGWQPLEIITGWWEWVWGNWSGLLWVLSWGDTEWPIITSGRCESCPNCHVEFKFSANKTEVWDNRIIYHTQYNIHVKCNGHFHAVSMKVKKNTNINHKGLAHICGGWLWAVCGGWWLVCSRLYLCI